MGDSILGKVSLKRNEITITQWENGEWGVITDPMSNCVFRFLKYEYTDKLYKVYSGQDNQQPILCYGFMGWLLHNRGKAVWDIFKGYYEAKKQEYIKQHEKDVDAWDRDLEQEYKRIHMEEEAKRINASCVLYQYLPRCDRDYIVEMCENYIMFTQKQNINNEIAKPRFDKSKLITPRVDKCFERAIQNGYMQELPNGTYEWERPKVQLGYFVYRVFDGSRNPIPFKSVGELFNITRLDNHVKNYIESNQCQKWKHDIDSLLG